MKLEHTEAEHTEAEHTEAEHTEAEHTEAEHTEEEPIHYSQLRLLNSLSRIAQPHPFGPRRGIESLLNEHGDNDMQLAIIASILDE